MEILSRTGIVNPRLLPSASDTLATLADLLQRANIRKDLAVTATEVVTAFALAVPFGALIGFLIVGVPGAVLLGAATFLLSVVPVGPPLVWGGAAFWLFQQGEPMWAVFMAAWGFFVVSTVDNFIKPFIISRGAKLPFAVVFLGVLGGVLAFGVIGAFLGPALLAVGFRLLNEWSASQD